MAVIILEWPDGINPYVEPWRREEILRARAERAAEIERWQREHPERE